MCFRPPSFDEMMKKCPACGSFNPPDSTVCKKCGADLPESAASDQGAAAPMSAPKGPGAPPKAPGAPAAPNAPQAPGSSKPPPAG